MGKCILQDLLVGVLDVPLKVNMHSHYLHHIFGIKNRKRHYSLLLTSRSSILGVPGGYTQVAHYRQWIVDKVRSHEKAMAKVSSHSD